MKIKKLLVLFPLIALFACGNNEETISFNLTSSSEQHVHTFSTEWSKDETYHWHAATCEHDTETKDKAEHTWDSGEITTQPTTETDGVKTYTCTVCGQTKTEKVDKLVWDEITYAQLEAAYNARENAPYNHMEGTYYEDGFEKPLVAVENLYGNVWTLDNEESSPGMEKLSEELIVNDSKIEKYRNIPTGGTIKVEKLSNGEEYRLEVTVPYNETTMVVNVVMDKYFFVSKYVEKYNNVVNNEVTGVWSTV